MTDIAKIAAGLTKAQREAVLGADWVKIGPYPGRWEVRTPRVWRVLVARGLAFEATGLVAWRRNPGYDRAALNDTGLAVRNHLKEQGNG